MNTRYRLLFVAHILFAAATSQVQGADTTATGDVGRSTDAKPTLPDGEWTGQLTSRLFQGVGSPQEWNSDLIIRNCKGSVQIRFKREDGTLTLPLEYEAVMGYRVALFISSDTTNPDGTGTAETQVWSLIDASPRGWTITQTRSIINQQANPDHPAFVFTRVSWGLLDFRPVACEQ